MSDNIIVLPGVTPPTEMAREAVSEDAGEIGAPPPELLVAAVEACLFAVPGVVTVMQLFYALRTPETQIREALATLQERLARSGGGVRLVTVGEGWQLRTDPRLAPWVASIRGGKPFRLSRAALETLAIVAFRQPVGKGALDDIRGVDCGGVLRMLLERGLVRAVGRTDDPGRPLTYGTTPNFLHLFGLRTLEDLPTLKDLRALTDDDARESAVVPSDVEAGPALRLVQEEEPG